MSNASFFFDNLAAAFLSGKWTPRAILARARLACKTPPRSLGKWVRLVLASISEPPGFEVLRRHLQNHERWFGSSSRDVGRSFWIPHRMSPGCEAAAQWAIPALATHGQLADWLQTAPAHLDWLADIHGWNLDAASNRLRHYRYQWLPKRGGRFRLLEAPKKNLKAIQRTLLHGILDAIPPHPAAHGFRRGRSILSYAAPHVGKHIVVRFDLADFFPSVTASRVHALFRMAGYPRAIARTLTGLCTTQTPGDVLASRPVSEFEKNEANWQEPFRQRHLAQGAPTSPALANLCAFRLDVRLAALAKKMGADYTRYADDLAFSGGPKLRQHAKRLQILVGVIAAEEGFRLNFRKCKFMSASVRQELAGVVVNVRPSGRRADFDVLKAILTNCIRQGAASQNRDKVADFRAHLLGRITHWMNLHPEKGKKLRGLFDRIDWTK